MTHFRFFKICRRSLSEKEADETSGGRAATPLKSPAAWEWGPHNRPHERYLCVSYASHLSERDNERCLNVIRSDRYQKLWGHRFSLLTRCAGRVKFANDKTGWKLASSVGGTVLGERGSRIILDDPNSSSDI
jgi:hypothetical protein